MDHVFVTAWVICFVQCSTASLLVNVPSLVQVNCPSTYRVQASSSKAIQLEVTDNKEECNRLARTNSINDDSNYGDVQPYISVVFVDGQYRANISWDFYPLGQRLPKIFLINLTFYDIEDLQHSKYLNNTCVSIRIVGNRKVKSQGPVKFYFDCLPLLNESDIGLELQLLSYSKSDRPCWSKRSVPEDKRLCDKTVQCSPTYNFPISKNAHTYRQCACYTKYYGTPKLNWTYDSTDGRFQIHFTNVPPYLMYAKIEIVDAQGKPKVVDAVNVQLYNSHPGEIHGNYILSGLEEHSINVHFDTECYGPSDMELHYKSEINDICSYAGRYSYNYSIPQSFVTQSTQSTPKYIQTILGTVGGGVVTMVILTTVICFLWHRRKLTDKNSRSGTLTDEIELRNNPYEPAERNSENRLVFPFLLLNEAESEFCETQTIEHNGRQQGLHCKHFHVEDRQTEAEYQPLVQEAIQNQEGIISVTHSIHVDREQIHNTQTDREVHVDREPSHTHKLLHISQQQRTRTNQSETFRAVEKSQNGTTFKDKKFQVLLLYYQNADNPRHTQRVREFEQILTRKFGVITEKITAKNWQYFAESAFAKFHNVVLIISEGLYNVCHNYLYSEQRSEELFSKQNREILPYIVLMKMQALVKERTVRQHSVEQMNVFLHIVALDSKEDDHILKLFLKDHHFLTTEYSHVYSFCGNDLHSTDIKPLVDRFHPTVEEGIPNDLRLRLMHINMESEGLKIDMN